MESTAKLFKNGRSQAVRLPKKFRFEGDEEKKKKKGN
ncbi:MAG: AbrB/MazE/SpoVT family DNA-binding domain-containing protein, partial [Deltaproteobacteria bacterium]|nr:AbrB/MazE/SpoVT family DNA-binding domain-containing protein [Deltaproteobacteria bacterium]